MTLIELVVVLSILAIALGEISRSLLTVSRLEPANHESTVALNAAISTLEELRAAPFDEVFKRYNEDPADDPDGPGTAPGPGFTIPGFDALESDVDGLVGRIQLPISGGELREDIVDSHLGMPRDLDGDGVIDGLDHAAAYDVLPVRVTVDWRGSGGDRTLSLCSTLIAEN